MKRKLALAVLVLLLASLTPAYTAPGGCTNQGVLFPMGYEQITVSSTAVGFTATVAFPAGQNPADMAQIVVETNSLRYRDDGLNPSATVGAPITAGSPYMVCGNATLRAARFIRQSADGTLNVLYYRQ